MKKEIVKSDSRGIAEHGWLHSRFSFSFAEYYDTQRIHFGLLRVLNDDIIEPGEGFETHPHDNMEIITIPLSGSLKHKDSTGSESIIKTNDVQIMSAGTGIMHSEFNNSASEKINLLQLWIYPKVKNIKPRYDQITFLPSERSNQLLNIVSPVKEQGKLWINQDAYLSLADFNSGRQIDYKLYDGTHGVYLFIIDGIIEFDGIRVNKRDALQITEADAFSLKTINESKLLFIEVPMNN